jgi:hypothetical protein
MERIGLCSEVKKDFEGVFAIKPITKVVHIDTREDNREIELNLKNIEAFKINLIETNTTQSVHHPFIFCRKCENLELTLS